MKSYCVFASKKETKDHQPVKTSDGKTMWIRVLHTEVDPESPYPYCDALDLLGPKMRRYETLCNCIPEEFAI